MTYLELLSWARKGLAAEKESWKTMQEQAARQDASDLMEGAQDRIEEIMTKEQVIAEMEEIHNRRY